MPSALLESCPVCVHGERTALEELILSGQQPLAASVGSVSLKAVRRHETQCLARIAASTDYEARHERVDLHGSCVRVMQEAARLGAKAEAAKDLRTALLGLREYARGAELLGKLYDGMSRADVPLERDARFLRVRDAILAALAPHPEALRDVVAALARTRGDS